MVIDTLKLAKELNCNFTGIHIAIPYEGMEFNKIARDSRILTDSTVGHNYFSNPAIVTIYVTKEELLKMRKQSLRSLYLNPRYIARTIIQIRNPTEIKNYTRYGLRLLKNLMKK